MPCQQKLDSDSLSIISLDKIDVSFFIRLVCLLLSITLFFCDKDVLSVLFGEFAISFLFDVSFIIT